MKRIAVVVAAVAALGVGVTVGSTHQEKHGPQAQTQTLSQDGKTWDQRMCEQAAQQVRAKHPDAYISGCNHGASTLRVP